MGRGRGGGGGGAALRSSNSRHKSRSGAGASFCTAEYGNYMGTQSWREFNPTLCELLARIRLQRPDLRLRFIVLSMQTVLTLEMQTDPQFGYRFRRLTVVRFHILGNDSWAFWRRFPLGWPYENDRIGPGGRGR